MSYLPPCSSVIFLSTDDAVTSAIIYTIPCVKVDYFITSLLNKISRKTAALNKSRNNITISMLYLPSLSFLILVLPIDAVTSKNFYTSPCIKENNFHSLSSIFITSFELKTYYRNCYYHKTQREKNTNAFCLPYGMMVEFR